MKAQIYDKIIDQLPFGVLYLSQGKVGYANYAAENIIGLSRAKLQKDFDDLLLFQDVKDYLKIAHEEHKVVKVYEERFVNYLGKEFFVNLYFIPIGTKDKEFLVIFEDCSFSKTIEKRKQDYDNVERMAELFASMAHEIKNPLGVIKGILQLIKKENIVEVEREAFDIIFAEISRIENVLQLLLDYSSAKKLNVQKFNLLDIFEEILSSLQPLLSEKRVVVIKEYDITFPDFLGDRESLYRAFFNILKNAIEASFIGGKIFIRVNPVLDIKYREGEKEYSYLQIDVEDRGVGIAEDDMKRLFTPFFTTKQSGTGLGLVYAQKVILDHHGFIRVDSKQNRGTRFSIFLPMKD